MKTDFYIKNMVCDRCIQVVSKELKKLPLEVEFIQLGEVKVNYNKNDEADIVKNLGNRLRENGFELLFSPEEQTVEKIKTLLVERVRNLPEGRGQKISSYLVSSLHRDYTGLSKVFSKCEGVTIEGYFIKLKIERVKELIQGGQYNFSEIADLLQYNTIHHLSQQFKKHTGISLSEYKSKPEKKRSAWDQVT